MEKLKCQICGILTENLSSHIRTHNITGKEYKQKYNVDKLLIVSDETKEKIKIARAKQISISVFSVKFWTIKGYTEIQAAHEIAIRQPVRIEYWINKGYTKKKAEEKCKDIRFNNSEAALIEKYGPTEGAKKYIELCSKMQKSSKRHVQYWIDNGHTLEEATQLVSSHQTHDLDFFIKKYGETEGKHRWEAKTKKWQQTMNSKSIEEINSINVKKDSKSTKYLKEKYKGEWINEALKHYKDSTKLRKLLSCESIDLFINQCYNILNYNEIAPILRNRLIIEKYNIIDPEQVNRMILLKHGMKYIKKQLYGSLILFDGYVFKSFPEVEIAKFLVDKNISYIYEKKYPNQKLRTDFYIEKYDVYIEYTGLMDHINYKYKINKKKDIALKYKMNVYFSNNLQDIKNYIEYYEKNH